MFAECGSLSAVVCCEADLSWPDAVDVTGLLEYIFDCIEADFEGAWMVGVPDLHGVEGAVSIAVGSVSQIWRAWATGDKVGDGEALTGGELVLRLEVLADVLRVGSVGPFVDPCSGSCVTCGKSEFVGEIGDGTIGEAEAESSDELAVEVEVQLDGGEML